MRKKQLLLALFLIAFITVLHAIPPQPGIGYRWVLLEDYSDEFNGTELDATKWNDYHPHWSGRKPAWFNPAAISVKDGYLQIKNGILDTPFNGYEIYGGAVTSKKSDAFYGYFECSFKASYTTMSTTFWLANEKVDYTPTSCTSDRYSLELDIAESIGDPKTWPAFGNSMKSNTHYRYVPCGQSSEDFHSAGATKALGVNVADTFNTFACWWHDENYATFYANNKKGARVGFSTDIDDKPFDRPMFINMVTETYSWEQRPTDESLLDNTKNTSYYDWVRTYKEVPIDEEVVEFDYADIYMESASIEDVEIYPLDSISFLYDYKANKKRELHIKLADALGNILASKKLDALKGFGRDQVGIKLDAALEKDAVYYYIIDIRPIDGTEEDTIQSSTVAMVKESIVESIGLRKTPDEPTDTIRFQMDCSVDTLREFNYVITDEEGVVMMSDKINVPRGTAREDMEVVLNFEPVVGITYTFIADIRPVGGNESDIIDSDSFDMALQPSSVKDHSVSDRVVIFPNPAGNQITLKGAIRNSAIGIYSPTGQLLVSGSLDENGVINITELKPGIYFMRVNDQTLKFIKE